MAIDVLTQIKTAEEHAYETRRVAAMAGKDALKLAEQENREIKDKELSEARRNGISLVDAAQEVAKAEFDNLQKEKLQNCEILKQKAKDNLLRAANICLERILG